MRTSCSIPPKSIQNRVQSDPCAKARRLRRAFVAAFASGTKRNDISQQMRNIARHMTAEEIDQVARYYEAQP
jgi:hypothetical protein